MFIKIKTLEQMGSSQSGDGMLGEIATLERHMHKDRIVEVDKNFNLISRSNGWGILSETMFSFHIWPEMINEMFNQRYTIYGKIQYILE